MCGLSDFDYSLEENEMSVVFIHGGTVIDPAQGLEQRADVVCEDGKIKELLSQPTEAACAWWKARADETIDASGRVVCPGFIDIHMHEDPIDAQTGRIEQNITRCMARMGVTTAVAGNCGSNEGEPDAYLDAVDAQGTAVNLALMAGHSFLRKKCGGRDKYAPVDEETVKQMEALGEKYLDAGCLGVSFGVKYVPGTRWEEIIALARLCRRGDKLVPSHVRNDVDGVFEACTELARIGQEASVKVQFSHVGSMGGYGQMETLLRQIGCGSDVRLLSVRRVFNGDRRDDLRRG